MKTKGSFIEVVNSLEHCLSGGRHKAGADVRARVRSRRTKQQRGRMEFHAPDRKTFAVTSGQGSGIVRRLALNPLIASEIKAAAGKDRGDSAISSANYQVEWIEEKTSGVTAATF